MGKTMRRFITFVLLLMSFVILVLTSVILGTLAGNSGDGGFGGGSKCGDVSAVSLNTVEALWNALDAKMSSDIVVRYSPSAVILVAGEAPVVSWSGIQTFWTSRFGLYWTATHQRTGLWPTRVGSGLVYAGAFSYSVKTPGNTMQTAEIPFVSVFEFAPSGSLIERQTIYWDSTPLLAANGLCIRPNHTTWTPGKDPETC